MLLLPVLLPRDVLLVHGLLAGHHGAALAGECWLLCGAALLTLLIQAARLGVLAAELLDGIHDSAARRRGRLLVQSIQLLWRLVAQQMIGLLLDGLPLPRRRG